MARNGIQLLSNWTTSVMEMVSCLFVCACITCTYVCNVLQYCWKLLHPTNEYDNKECPKDAEAYEKVRATVPLLSVHVCTT